MSQGQQALEDEVTGKNWKIAKILTEEFLSAAEVNNASPEAIRIALLELLHETLDLPISLWK